MAAGAGVRPTCLASPSREVAAGRGVDGAVRGALKVSVGSRQVRFTRHVAKVESVAVLHTPVSVTISTVGPVTADAVVTSIVIPVVTFLSGLQDPVPTGAAAGDSIVPRVERGQLNGEPAKAVLEVQGPLVPAEGDGVLGVQSL